MGRPRTQPDEPRADKAHASKAVRRYLREHKITATIPEKKDVIAARKRKGSKGGRPPAFDAQSHKGRNVVERFFRNLKQWRGVATRYGKLALVYRASVVAVAVVTWLRKLSDTPQRWPQGQALLGVEHPKTSLAAVARRGTAGCDRDGDAEDDADDDREGDADDEADGTADQDFAQLHGSGPFLDVHYLALRKRLMYSGDAP